MQDAHIGTHAIARGGLRGAAGATVIAVLAGCAVSAPMRASVAANAAMPCVPGDQDTYVYASSRFEVLTLCTRASGTVAAVEPKPDGDFHVLVTLDGASAGLANAVNGRDAAGDLVVEPICERPPTEPDIARLCANDPDPVRLDGLVVGEHVWLEGRAVIDTAHGGWAELHPLYRWGLLPPTGPSPIAPSATVSEPPE